MAVPSGSYLGELPEGLRREWDHFYAQLGGWLGAGVFERGRSVASGDWTPVTFVAANFTGNGTLVWTVEIADQATLAYTLIGKTMTVSFYINDTTVAGTGSVLQIRIPGGFLAKRAMANACALYDNATFEIGFVSVDAGGGTINIRRPAAANWTASANSTTVLGQLAFEVE